MQSLTEFELFFLDLLRGLNEQQLKDVIRIMEAFLLSSQ